MSNFTKLLLVVFAIHFTLVITEVVGVPGSALYSFLTNPSNWGSMDIISLLSDSFLTTAGILTIVAGASFLPRGDLVIFATMATVFLSFGLPLVSLFNLISAQLNWIMATVIVGPILAIYILTVVAWWRGSA